MVFRLPSTGLFHCLVVAFLVSGLNFTFAYGDSNGAGTETALKCVSASFASDSTTSNLGNVTEQLSPVVRFIGVCPGQPASVGVILEMHAQFRLLFTTIFDEERCVTVGLRAKPSGPELQAIPKNRTNVTFSLSRSAKKEAESKIRRKLDHRNASFEHQRVLTEIPLDQCSNTSRTLSLGLDVLTENVNDSVLKPWLLEFTWKRTPEHYEVGEVGWSIVGALPGTLSGTYSLTDVRLFLNLHNQWELELIDPKLVGRPLVLHAGGRNLFRVRAGDFYQCDSEHSLLLTSPPADLTASRTSQTASKEPFVANNVSRSANDYGIRAVLSTRNLRLQVFSDYNDDEFTGSGVICKEDIHEDHTVTFAIGVTVCVVVAIAMIGLMITRLHETDRGLQALDVAIFNAKHQIPSGRPINLSTFRGQTGRPEGCHSPPPYRDRPV